MRSPILGGPILRLMRSVTLKRALSGLPIRTSARPAIFIHIPKCAGTSVRASLGIEQHKSVRAIVDLYHHRFPVCFGHLSLQDLIDSKVVGRWAVDRSFVFTVVRDPFRRAVSLYRYLWHWRLVVPRGETPSRKGGWIAPTTVRDDPENFVAFLHRIRAGIPPVGLYNNRGLSQCNPQTDWLPDRELDLVARVETLEADLEVAAERVLGRPLTVRRLNTSHGSATGAELLSEEAVELIRDIYRSDFERFGYPMEPAR